eukprot:2385216-Amphidinium_carterae.2
MEQSAPGEKLQWFSIDIANAFYLIPMRREERRHLAIAFKGRWMNFRVTAMGSRNGPAAWGGPACALARMTQAILWCRRARLTAAPRRTIQSLHKSM